MSASVLRRFSDRFEFRKSVFLLDNKVQLFAVVLITAVMLYLSGISESYAGVCDSMYPNSGFKAGSVSWSTEVLLFARSNLNIIISLIAGLLSFFLWPIWLSRAILFAGSVFSLILAYAYYEGSSTKYSLMNSAAAEGCVLGFQLGAIVFAFFGTLYLILAIIKHLNLKEKIVSG